MLGAPRYVTLRDEDYALTFSDVEGRRRARAGWRGKRVGY